MTYKRTPSQLRVFRDEGKYAHGHRAERLEHAEEAVRMQEQLPVRQALLPHVARRA
jgi:hypothetical protein